MFFCELYYESSTFAFCDQFVACNCGFQLWFAGHQPSARPPPRSTWNSTSLQVTPACTVLNVAGDSRYFVWRCNWCVLGGMDRFVRPHATTSLIDYAQNRSPGEMISLGTGDSNVYSVFRNSRYTANFVCVVNFFRVTVYLQDNSAPLFLKALEYAIRVFQYLSGNAVREIVSDMFSTYRQFLRHNEIILSAMPTYMHWMNHIAGDMIHRSTISTRVCMPGLRGKIIKGQPIDDPSVYHPFCH